MTDGSMLGGVYASKRCETLGIPYSGGRSDARRWRTVGSEADISIQVIRGGEHRNSSWRACWLRKASTNVIMLSGVNTDTSFVWCRREVPAQWDGSGNSGGPRSSCTALETWA